MPNDIPVSRLQSDSLAFTTLLARHLILLSWKQAAPPSHIYWVRIVMQFIKLKTMKFTLWGCTGTFYASHFSINSKTSSLPVPVKDCYLSSTHCSFCLLSTKCDSLFSAISSFFLPLFLAILFPSIAVCI